MQETLIFNKSQELFRLITDLCNKQTSGEVVLYNGEASSKIYLVNGKVSWAFASGQPESFQSKLLKDNLASKEQIIQGIRNSREKGTSSLDNILKEVGLSESETRLAIIKHHTQSAMNTIASWNRCVGKLIEKELSKSEQDSIAIEFSELILGVKESLKTREKKQLAIRQEIKPANSLPEVLNYLREEIPYFLAAMIIDGQTGMPVTSLVDIETLDVEIVSAYYRDLVKSAQDAQEALGTVYGATEKSVQEILVTTENDYVILQTLDNGRYVLYLLLDKTSNPGMAKVILRRYMDALVSFL